MGPVTTRLEDRGLLRAGAILFLGLLALQAALGIFGLGDAYAALIDFDAFHVAGQLVWEGRAAAGYAAAEMAPAQAAFSGTADFMPWSYPPQFDLVAAALALVPRALSFTLFVGLTLMAYLWVLRRLAGGWLWPVLIAAGPAIEINLKIGQNGFLTGALAGGFCLMALEGRARAGLPLGFMVIKPHLALGLGVWLLAGRRWGAVGIAAAVVVLTSALATLAFGPGIWAAFLGGAAETSAFLQKGVYPLYRMGSLFAALRGLGLPAGPALAAQAVLALAVCAVTAFAALRIADRRLSLAVAVFGTVMVSPYSYDYDLTLLGVALALVAPRLMAVAGDGALLAVLVLAWAATGTGLAHVALAGPAGAAPIVPTGAIAFAAYAGLAILVARLLGRVPAGVPRAA